MLVLAYANRLRVDLHEFRERVLQAAANRDRAAHSEVEVGEFLAGDFACGVYRRACLAYGDDNRRRNLGMLRVELLQRVAHERLRLAPRRSVADGDCLNMVFRDDHRDGLRRLEGILLREDYCLAEILASRVKHRYLAAGADARVDCKDCLFAERRGKEKMAQVFREHLDSRAVCLGLLVHRDVDFARRREKPPVGVVSGELKLFVARHVAPRAASSRHDFNNSLDDRVFVKDELDPKHAFLLSAANREIAVRGNRRYWLLEVIVLLVLRRLFRCGACDFALDARTAGELAAHETAHVGIVGDSLRDYVARELQVFVCRIAAIPLERAPFPDCVCERFVSLLLRDLCTSAALRLVGLVDILEARLHKASGNCSAKLVCKLALLVD